MLMVVEEKDGKKELSLDTLFEEMFPEVKQDDPEAWKMYFEPGNDGKLRFIPKLLGDDIQTHVKFKTIKQNGRMYRYAENIYKEDGKQFIQEVVKRRLGKHYSGHNVRETISYIEACTFCDITDIQEAWLNLENGLLNPVTKEFRDHTANVFTITRIPLRYDPTADCPLFKQKLADKIEPEVINVLQEMFGYCYLSGQKFERAFLFYGPKRTMKSTVLFMLSSMLGDDNVSAFPLQQLTEDSFAAAYLFGKMANVCADLDSRGLKDVGRFMTITGGDKITAGRKHEHHMHFYPSAKLIFSCNTIPSTTNKDLSFYRRWIILPFLKQTDQHQVDPFLKDKLLKELPGILNWSLQGLDRLLSQKKFSYWLDEEGIKDLYERSSDSISSFILNNIDCENDDGAITKRDCYKAYQEYCAVNRLPRENVIKFGRMFQALTGCGTCKKGVIPAYSGVAIKGTQAVESGVSGALDSYFEDGG